MGGSHESIDPSCKAIGIWQISWIPSFVLQEQYQQLDGLLKAFKQATAKSGARCWRGLIWSKSGFWRSLKQKWNDMEWHWHDWHISNIANSLDMFGYFSEFAPAIFSGSLRPDETKRWPILHSLRRVWQASLCILLCWCCRMLSLALSLLLIPPYIYTWLQIYIIYMYICIYICIYIYVCIYKCVIYIYTCIYV